MNSISSPRSMQVSPSDDDLTRNLGWSALAHLGLAVALLFYQKLIFPHVRIKPQAYQVSVVSLTPPKGKGAQTLAPPAVAPSEPENHLPRATAAQIEEAVSKPVQKDAMPVQKPKATDLKKEMARLKEELKRQDEIRRITKSISQAIAAKTDVKSEGKISSPAPAAAGTEAKAGEGSGGSPDGVSGQLVLGQYQDIVRQHVLAQWNLPQWTIDELPKYTVALVVVYINAAGEVLRTEFAKSSTIEHFDQSALRAVRRASPLPQPPSDLQREAEVKGIRMRFSPTKE